MSKMIAVFEVEFDSDMMFDEESIKKDFNGDWLMAMQWLYEEDDIGIFNEKLKLVDVRAKVKKLMGDK